MIQSFVFNDGKLVASNLDSDALRLVRADKGLLIWVNLFAPTAEETRTILEDVFSFHPLAIEDCLSVSRYPKIEDYEDYLFVVMHAVAFNKEEQFRTTELDFFIGKSFLVTHHSEPLATVTSTVERIQKNPAAISFHLRQQVGHLFNRRQIHLLDNLGRFTHMLFSVAHYSPPSLK